MPASSKELRSNETKDKSIEGSALQLEPKKDQGVAQKPILVIDNKPLNELAVSKQVLNKAWEDPKRT